MMSLVNQTQFVPVSEFTLTGFNHLSNQTLLGILILLAYLFILIGSSTNISIIMSDRRLHIPMYLFICNLAVVDIMFATSASTTMISALLVDRKTISYYSCASRMYIYHFGDWTGSHALALMAVDRVIAISNPLRYPSILTNSRSIAMITTTWMLGFAVMGYIKSIVDSLPYCQPILQYVFCDYPCLVRAACVNPQPYFIPSTIVGFWIIIIFPIIFLTYVKIVYTVVSLSNVQSRKQMFSTCLSHIIVLMCYYIPKLVSVFLTRLGVVLTLTERNALLIVSTLVPPVINPTVYCLRTKEIRKRLLAIFKTKIVPTK